MKNRSQIISLQQNANKEVKNYNLGKEVQVQINSLAIIPIIADKIYKNPMSAIRELYNNEVTACEKAHSLNPKLKQKIKIELNTDTRELTIQGFNSLGMDGYTFNKILTVMGNSGNANAEQKGLFGIGFFSFFKLSERIIIISNSLETKEKFAYICKSALKFEQLQKENYDELKTTGFKIIINIKDSVELDQIKDYVINITKLSGIETELIIDGSEKELTQFKDLEDCFKSHYSEYFNDPLTCNYSLIYEHIDQDDYELIAFQISHSRGETPFKKEECYLLNTPIELDLRVSYEIGYLINLKSERTYKPTPDRERLEQESEDNIKKEIEELDIEGTFSSKTADIEPANTIQEWYNNDLRYFINVIGKTKSYDGISLRTDVKSLNYNDSYNHRHRYRDLEDHLPIIEPLSFGFSKSFRKVKFKELWDEDQKFCITPRLKNDNFIKCLESIGFKDIIKHPKRSSNGTKRNYKQHVNNNFKYHYRTNCYDEYQNDNDIIIRSHDLAEDKALLRYLHDDKICFVSPLANCPEAIDWKDFYKVIKNECVWTNRGLMSIDQIMKGIKHRHYTKYCDDITRLKTLFNESGFIILFNNNNELLGRLEFYMKKFIDKHYLTSETIEEPYYTEIKEQLTDPLLVRIFEDKYSSYNFESDDFNLWTEMIKEYQT